MEEENKKPSVPETEENIHNVAPEEVKFNDLNGESLSDRVKTLSPGMTVLKRFFRSKLSVVGLVIIILLFLISFIGPLFSPWGEMEVDYKEKTIVNYEETRYEQDGEIH